MAIREKILSEIFLELYAGYSRHSKYPQLVDLRINFLTKLNNKFGEIELAISRQGEQFDNLLFQLIDEYHVSEEPLTKEAEAEAIQNIFDTLYDLSQAQTWDNKTRHEKSAIGQNFSSEPLHKFALEAEMQDHHINKMMPKSTSTTRVFYPVNFSGNNADDSDKEVAKDITAFFDTQKNKPIHAVLPIGPGHWRGLYISRPLESDAPYQVEIFDSVGKKSAKVIEARVKRLLEYSGVKNVEITYAEPHSLQKDRYSCGDFVCAYSHKKLKELGGAEALFNLELIEALDKHEPKVREITRKLSEEIVKAEEAAKAAKAAEVASVEQAVPPSSGSPHKETYTEVLRDLSKDSAPPVLQNPQSQVDSGAPAPKKARLDESRTDSMKKTGSELIHDLINKADDIHEKARIIREQQKAATQKPDDEDKDKNKESEELATLLQAEELTRAGFKPK